MFRDYILVLYDQEGTKAFVDEIISNDEFRRYNIQYMDFRNTHNWCENLNAILKEKDRHPRLIISGTSLNHNKWHKVWGTALEHNIKIVAIVDSWQNLQERFITCSIERSNWPNIICLIDEKIESTIKMIKGIESKVVCIGHPILSRLYDQRSLKIKEFHNNFLYVSEPITTSKEKYNASRLTRVQRNSFATLCEFAAIRDKDISIKLHPRETDSHFAQYKLLSNNRCRVKLETPLTKQRLLDTRWVAFGLTSMLLIELYLSGSSCISLLERKVQCEQSFFKYYANIIPRINSKEELLELKIDELISKSIMLENDNTFIKKDGFKLISNMIDGCSSN